MACELEMVLTHDGRDWVSRNDELGIRVTGETLGALDAALMAALAARSDYAGRKVCVVMRFDNASIPTWIRQYASHYFNRLVELDLRAGTATEHVA